MASGEPLADVGNGSAKSKENYRGQRIAVASFAVMLGDVMTPPLKMSVEQFLNVGP